MLYLKLLKSKGSMHWVGGPLRALLLVIFMCLSGQITGTVHGEPLRAVLLVLLWASQGIFSCEVRLVGHLSAS